MSSTPAIHKHIRVRVFRDEDGPRCRELFGRGIGHGPGSARVSAIRGTLTSIQSILSGCLCITSVGMFNHPSFVQGILARCLSLDVETQAIIIPAVLLAYASLAFYFVHLWIVHRTFLKHSDTTKHTDMHDIVSHYKIGVDGRGATYLSGPDGFWVAELVDPESPYGEVVGCVGLDMSPRKTPGVGELRRMAVSSAQQRRGIGRMLLETALAHAKTHGITTIYLMTTAHQRSAVGIYEKFGWKNIGPPKNRMAPWWVDARVAEFKLDLLEGGRSGNGHNEWEKMA